MHPRSDRRGQDCHCVEHANGVPSSKRSRLRPWRAAAIEPNPLDRFGNGPSCSPQRTAKRWHRRRLSRTKPCASGQRHNRRRASSTAGLRTRTSASMRSGECPAAYRGLCCSESWSTPRRWHRKRLLCTLTLKADARPARGRLEAASPPPKAPVRLGEPSRQITRRVNLRLDFDCGLFHQTQKVRDIAPPIGFRLGFR